jgi:hypothetical protein
LGRAADADQESKLFQEIKKRQVGAAVPEDLDWSFYAEIYEPFEPHPPVATGEPTAQPHFSAKKLASGIDPKTAGMIVLDFNGDGHPDLLVWSAAGVGLYKSGSIPVENSGLADLRGVVSVAAGDFNNDGFTDLCVITDAGARPMRTRRVFHQLPRARASTEGHVARLRPRLRPRPDSVGRETRWFGITGWRIRDMTAEFPFAPGHVTTAGDRRSSAENGADLAVAYAEHAGVLATGEV